MNKTPTVVVRHALSYLSIDDRCRAAGTSTMFIMTQKDWLRYLRLYQCISAQQLIGFATRNWNFLMYYTPSDITGIWAPPTRQMPYMASPSSIWFEFKNNMFKDMVRHWCQRYQLKPPQFRYRLTATPDTIRCLHPTGVEMTSKLHVVQYVKWNNAPLRIFLRFHIIDGEVRWEAERVQIV